MKATKLKNMTKTKSLKTLSKAKQRQLKGGTGTIVIQEHIGG